jgi:hypothetical protein
MNEFFATVVDFDSVLQSADTGSLVFVNDAEYEFVGGGAASTNCL